jgi:hypothetical protein
MAAQATANPGVPSFLLMGTKVKECGYQPSVPPLLFFIHTTNSVEGMFWTCQSVPNWLFLVKTYERSLLVCSVVWRWFGRE